MNEPASILLVDDQDRNLDALEAILGSSGYRLVRARSADEALLALLKGDYAAIVCDIRMPGVGGIELAQMIKQRKRSEHIPIVFLTAHTIEDEELLLGYGAGAVDYLSKPINPEVLRLKLGVFVELFRKTRALAHANQALADEVIQRQRAEENLRLAKEELEQRVEARTTELTVANRAKDHFLAVLSHELRTPLTPVLATVQNLLHDPAVPPQLQESLDVIHRNVELEARLIDDLLDLTRISRGKMELQRSNVDIHQVLEHAVRTCDADFREKNIALHVSLNACQTHVLGDRARLLQVFWNLLKNAAKFTPIGKSVEVRTTDAPGNLIRVEVRDTGIGIDPASIDSIFNAFEQGNATTTRKYGGLGLGLSIGKTLVELHGGTIVASSSGLGQGACFTLELPVGSMPAATPPQDAAASIVERIGPNHDHPASPRRLLLIEDHPDTCHVMRRLLCSAGYDVTAAQSVAEALHACQHAPKPFDVVVSDLGLPDGSGLDFMRQFRAHSPTIPAIALSGFGMEDDRLRSLDAGFVAHLTKPVDLPSLQSKIEEVISQAARNCQPPLATSTASR
jgi:signal transduction histidine kinase